MDSFEVNKLLGAFLGTVFVVFSISLASDALFAAHEPEKPGFLIEAAEPEAGGAGPAKAEVEPIAVRLASANAEAGATVFKKCQACHTGEQGGANKVGPNLWEIVNRPIATHEGFSYSGAIKTYSEGGQKKWTFEELSEFLVSPKAHIPGTAMGFAGIKDPKQEANLIAFLRTLSANPAPLPEAPAADAKAAEAPAGGAAPAAAGNAPANGAAAPANGSAASGNVGSPTPPAAGAQTPQPTTTDNGNSASPEPDAGQSAPPAANAPANSAPAQNN